MQRKLGRFYCRNKRIYPQLDDDAQIHPCNIQQAFAGYEALEAMCISALEHRRVDLPMKLELGGDINERMRRELPEVLRKKLP